MEAVLPGTELSNSEWIENGEPVGNILYFYL